MCLAQITDAASVRKSKKAAALSDLKAWSALASLASRYNCSEDGESLVTILMRVTLENKAATESLTKTCQEAQDEIAAQLEEQLAAADKMENEEAPASGLVVYNEAMKVADEAFSAIETTHSNHVASAATSAEEARVKMEEADAVREAEVKKKDEAQAVYQELLVDLEDYLKAKTTAFDDTRNVLVEEAKTTRDHDLDTAANVKKASDLTCQNTYDARMALVTKDEDTIHNEIKPLLDELQLCQVPSFLEISSAKKAAHGRTRGGHKAETKCDAVRRELKAKTLLLETSTMKAFTADTPAQEVTGDVEEWIKRIEAEKTEAATVLKSCQDEASHILDEITDKINAVFQAAETAADKLYDESLEKLKAEQEEQKAAGKAVADATLEPAAHAEAEFEAAKTTFNEKDAAHAAAITAQEEALERAHEEHVTAEEEARQAQLAAENAKKEEANVLRAVAKEDAEKRAANKEEECNSELAALKTDLELIAKIQEKMATLTTVDNDILGAKAEADAADFENCTTHCHHGVCEKATEDALYHCECNAGYSGSTCETNIDECA
jgi:hypothetical protein